jgi:hypothetical protein
MNPRREEITTQHPVEQQQLPARTAGDRDARA